MLQFITAQNNKYSLAEQVQMALEGGCRWIQIQTGTPDREEIESVKEMCKENEAFLVVENDIALAIDLKLHGVVISDSALSPAAVREQLGPDAVIGAYCNDALQIMKLNAQDIDYVLVGPFGPTCTPQHLRSIVSDIRNNEADIHIVVYGDIKLADVPAIMSTGVSGIALSKEIIDAADPVDTVSKYLSYNE